MRELRMRKRCGAKAARRALGRLGLAGVAALGFAGVAGPARALPIVELVWVASSGSGTLGSSAIGAAPGDVLTGELRLTAGPEGVSSYAVSLRFDLDLGNELDLVSVTELTPPGFSFSFSPGVALAQDSSATRPGLLLSFEAATLGLGPASRSFAFGRVELRVGAPVASDGPDLELGLWNPGVDGLYDNDGADLAPGALFGTASVDAVPEPATAHLLGLGLAALVWGAGLCDRGARGRASPPARRRISAV